MANPYRKSTKKRGNFMVFFSSPRFPSENLDLELVRIAFPAPGRDEGFSFKQNHWVLSTIIKLQRGGGRWKVVVYLRFPSKRGRVYMICRSNAWEWCTSDDDFVFSYPKMEFSLPICWCTKRNKGRLVRIPSLFLGPVKWEWVGKQNKHPSMQAGKFRGWTFEKSVIFPHGSRCFCHKKMRLKNQL